MDFGLRRRTVSIFFRVKPGLNYFTIFFGLTACRISVPMPKYSKEIPCSAFGKISSSTLYLSRSRDVKYIGPPDIIGWKVISFVTDGVVTTYSVTAPATTNSPVMVSSGGSTTFGMS